jgi:hypothetical protein
MHERGGFRDYSLRKPISGDIEGMIVLESASLVESDC